MLFVISFDVWLPSVPNFQNQSNNAIIFICGILSLDECFSVTRLNIDEINDLFKFKCLDLFSLYKS